MILRGYERLKMTEPTQWFAGHDRFPGIPAERMKPIIAFSAEEMTSLRFRIVRSGYRLWIELRVWARDQNRTGGN